MGALRSHSEILPWGKVDARISKGNVPKRLEEENKWDLTWAKTFQKTKRTY